MISLTMISITFRARSSVMRPVRARSSSSWIRALMRSASFRLAVRVDLHRRWPWWSV